MAKMEDQRELRCSFCGKMQNQVQRLIAGPGVCICNECVELCQSVLEDDMPASRSSRPQRQEQQIEAFRREEARLLPEDADYASIAGLRLEARQKLADIRPRSIGQAGRISGVSPADIAVLLIWLSQRNENSTDHAE